MKLLNLFSLQNWYSYQYNCVQVFEFLKTLPGIGPYTAAIFSQ